MCVTWPIHVCDMRTHSYVWHGSFICLVRIIHMCAMTHLYVCHDSFVCVSWLIHVCVISHSCAYVRNDWFIRVNYLIQMRTTRLVGWLRLVGSQVSFAKEHYERDYILPKRPMIWRSLLIVATPYQRSAYATEYILKYIHIFGTYPTSTKGHAPILEQFHGHFFDTLPLALCACLWVFVYGYVCV